MKITPVPTFQAEDGRIIQFFLVADRVLRQTTTHRVVINGIAVDWLGAGFRPTAKTALFFLQKHGTN